MRSASKRFPRASTTLRVHTPGGSERQDAGTPIRVDTPSVPLDPNLTTVSNTAIAETTASPRAVQRVGGLDGIRGVAALGIVIHHIISSFFYRYEGFIQVPPPWAPNAFVFVDLFFVLSGYLVTTISLRHLAPNPRGVLRFYGQRAARLLPALAALFACYTVYAWLSGLSMRNEAKSLIPYLTFTTNLANLVPFGFDNIRVFTPLWTLAVEWQFYMIAPLLLIVLAPLKRSRQFAMILVCVVGIVMWRSQQFRAGTSPVYLYTRTDFRIDSLLVGMALALAWPWIMRLSKSVLAIIGWVGVAGFAAYVANTSLSDDHLYTVGFTLIAVCAAWVVAGTAAGVGPSQLLSNRLLQLVGRVSYSLYIWHMFVIITVMDAFPDSPRFVLIIMSVIAIGLVTAASWSFVEQPAAAFFRQRMRINRRLGTSQDGGGTVSTIDR